MILLPTRYVIFSSRPRPFVNEYVCMAYMTLIYIFIIFHSILLLQ